MTNNLSYKVVWLSCQSSEQPYARHRKWEIHVDYVDLVWVHTYRTVPRAKHKHTQRASHTVSRAKHKHTLRVSTCTKGGSKYCVKITLVPWETFIGHHCSGGANEVLMYESRWCARKHIHNTRHSTCYITTMVFIVICHGGRDATLRMHTEFNLHIL